MLESGIALQEAMQVYKNESYDEERVECEWCHEPTPEDELVNTDIGKICEYCVQELKSRGEPVSIIYNESTKRKSSKRLNEEAEFIPGVSNVAELGQYYVDEVYGGVMMLPDDTIEEYFDYAEFGRELDSDDYADMYDEDELAQMYEDGDIESEDSVSAREYLGLSPDASDYDIGMAFASQVGLDGVEDKDCYFDYEAYGKDLAENGTFTPDGFMFNESLKKRNLKKRTLKESADSRVIQYAIDVDARDTKGDLCEEYISDVLSDAGIKVLDCWLLHSWKSKRDYYGQNVQESVKKVNEAFGLGGFLEEPDKINSADDLIDYFEAYLYNDEFNQEDVADFAMHTITKLLSAISPSEVEKLIAEYNNDISGWLDESIKRKPVRKLTEANANEPMFQAFITNLGKYNEGDLVGEWCAFPIDEDDFEALLKKIGIDGREYEEWFVTDYECQLKGFNWQDLGEYPSYDDLQEVGETLENIDDIEKFDNVYEAIGNFKYAVEAYDNAWFVPEVSDYSDLGVYYIEEAYGYNIPDDLIERYFDFEALGRDLDFDNYADMYDEEELAQMYANGDIQAEDYVSAGEYFGLGSNASDYDVGEAYVNEVGIDSVNDAQNYFDYEKFGRDLAYDGAFTSDGFVFTA